MATRNDPTPDVVERMREEVSSLLGAAPSEYSPVELGAAADLAANSYQPPAGRDAEDPEDVTSLLVAAFNAIGRPVPRELLMAARAEQKPVRVVGDTTGALPEEDEIERQERVQRKYEKSLGGIGQKRANMVAALNNSPAVVFFNRKDRDFLVNQVRIRVPEGQVRIPALVARLIEDTDAHAHWAEQEKIRAQQFLNIERPASSFQPIKVREFSIS